jgi:hypothetical protein
MAQEIWNECQTCGEEYPDSEEKDIETCKECCDHENTRDTLSGKFCEDCGFSLPNLRD